MVVIDAKGPPIRWAATRSASAALRFKPAPIFGLVNAVVIFEHVAPPVLLLTSARNFAALVRVLRLPSLLVATPTSHTGPMFPARAGISALGCSRPAAHSARLWRLIDFRHQPHTRMEKPAAASRAGLHADDSGNLANKYSPNRFIRVKKFFQAKEAVVFSRLIQTSLPS